MFDAMPYHTIPSLCDDIANRVECGVGFQFIKTDPASESCDVTSVQDTALPAPCEMTMLIMMSIATINTQTHPFDLNHS